MAEELETRKCIITGEIKPKSELLRFTVLQNGAFIPDFDKKIGGKGVYVSNSASLLKNIDSDFKIGKILHKPVRKTLPLAEAVDKILADKGLYALNLARKSGNLVLGFEKIKEQILKNKVSFGIEATDAGSDGKKKMSEMCKNIEMFSVYNSAVLEKAFDRETVIHVAVLKSEISTMVYENIKRYRDYLNG